MTDTPDIDTGAGAPDERAADDASGRGATPARPDGVTPPAAPGEPARTGASPGSADFDDDRLLDYALGLEDDAELESALAGDATLRSRLERVQAALDEAEAGLARLVPGPGEDYADPAAARWDGLRPYFAPPPERRPSRRGWRVLVPVLGAVLALAVVGAFALRGGGLGSQTAEERGAEATQSLGAPEAGADATKAAYGAEDLARDAESYGTVFVARAGEVADGSQHFAVVRRVKGLVTDDLYLDVVAAPIPTDTLVLVLMGPAAPGEEAAPVDEDSATASPVAGEGVDAAHAAAGFVPYDYQGVETLALPLPTDADLDELLP